MPKEPSNKCTCGAASISMSAHSDWCDQDKVDPLNLDGPERGADPWAELNKQIAQQVAAFNQAQLETLESLFVEELDAEARLPKQ